MTFKSQTSHRNWCFLLCYLAYSAYTVDFISRAFIQPQLMSLYHMSPMTYQNHVHTLYWGLIIGVLVFGCLVDKLRFKTCFIWVGALQILGLLKLFLVSPMMSMEASHHQLTVSMLFMGMGEGGIFAIIHPLLALAFKESDYNNTTIMTYLHTNWPIFIILGALFEIYLIRNNFDWTINKYSMLFFPCLYLFVACLLPLPQQSFAHPIPLSSRVRSVLRPGFMLLLFGMAFSSTIEHSPAAWMRTVVTSQLHIKLIYFLLFFYSINILARLMVGMLTRRVSPPALLCISSILSIGSLYTLGHSHNTLLTWFSMGLFSISVSWYWPTFIAIVIDRYPLSGGFGMGLMNFGGFWPWIIFIPPLADLSKSEGTHQAFLSLSWFAVLAFVLLSTVYTFFSSQGGYKAFASSEKSV